MKVGPAILPSISRHLSASTLISLLSLSFDYPLSLYILLLRFDRSLVLGAPVQTVKNSILHSWLPPNP